MKVSCCRADISMGYRDIMRDFRNAAKSMVLARVVGSLQDSLLYSLSENLRESLERNNIQ